MRRKFFTQRVMTHWNRLPNKVVDAPSLEAIQGQAGCGSGQPGLVVGDSFLHIHTGECCSTVPLQYDSFTTVMVN